MYQRDMPAIDDLRIGDFSKPLTDSPKSPTKESLDTIEKKISTDIDKDEAALRPMSSFEDKLKKEGLTREEAADIIDAVLLKGHYAEDVKITSRVKARFRTRTSRDTKRAQEMIEVQRLTYDVHYNEILSRLLLAASLERFGDDVLPHPPRSAKQEELEKAFQARLEYVNTMADPALRILMSKLAKFDRRVAASLEEGSIENF